MTCYNCKATDHVFQSCPKRLEKARGRKNEQAATWSQVAKHTNTAIHSSGHTATHVSNYNMIQGEGIQDVTNGSPNKEPEPNMEQPTLTNYEQGKEPQTNSNTDIDSKCIDNHMEKRKESECNTTGKTKEAETPCQKSTQQIEYTISNDNAKDHPYPAAGNKNSCREETRAMEGIDDVEKDNIANIGTRNNPQKNKKLKLENNSELPPERKRSRSRKASTNKGK